jgi:polysaccharide deacetylase family protein (PEP-CTERM system associated)
MNRDNIEQSVMNALTFDLEEWFHGLRVACPERYESRLTVGVERILAILEQFGAKATFFVLASVAGTHKRLLRYIAARGHEIGSHGLHHVPIYEQSPAQFRQELGIAIDTLEDITGERVNGYRAPFFSITPRTLWALDVMAEVGLVYDSSAFPVVNPRYGMPQAPRFPHWLSNGLLEFPISTLRLGAIGLNIPFSGGFYARFFGAQAVRWGIRRLNAHRKPALVYFHPWELDPQHPRIRSRAVSSFYHFTHYHRLGATSAVLQGILAEFRFVPLRRLAEQYQAAPVGTSLSFDYMNMQTPVSGQPG